MFHILFQLKAKKIIQNILIIFKENENDSLLYFLFNFPESCSALLYYFFFGLESFHISSIARNNYLTISHHQFVPLVYQQVNKLS